MGRLDVLKWRTRLRGDGAGWLQFKREFPQTYAHVERDISFKHSYNQ